jgi:hypothetical protein
VEVLTKIATCERSLFGLVRKCGGKVEGVGCARCAVAGDAGGPLGLVGALVAMATAMCLRRRRAAGGGKQ